MVLFSTVCTDVLFQDAIETFNTLRQLRCKCEGAERSDRSGRSLSTLRYCAPLRLSVRLCGKKFRSGIPLYQIFYEVTDEFSPSTCVSFVVIRRYLVAS